MEKGWIHTGKSSKLWGLTAAFLLMVSGVQVSMAASPGRMEKAVSWAVDVAKNPVHGYSQGKENATPAHPYTGSREGPDYDCSSLVYHALDKAGFPVIAAWRKDPVYQNVYHGKQQTGDADTLWRDLKAVGGFTRYPWAAVKDHLQRGGYSLPADVSRGHLYRKWQDGGSLWCRESPGRQLGYR